MGWSSGNIHSFGSMKEFVNQFNTEYGTNIKRKVLDYAVVKRTNLYVALQIDTLDMSTQTWNTYVTCSMVMFKFNKYEYAYQGFSEIAGPYMYDCPERILKLLTPTQDVSALEWRSSCYQRLADKKTIVMKPGQVFVRQGQKPIVLQRPYGNSKQKWLGSYQDAWGSFYVTKKWLGLHGYLPQEEAFSRLL